MLRNADGGGGVKISGKKRYDGVRFNVISVTRGWVRVQFPEKKRYVTLEWPHTGDCIPWYTSMVALHFNLFSRLLASPLQLAK